MDALDDYRLFVRLVESGGLSAAARQLGSSAPALSRRLQALEARLGVRLVERSPRRFVLTEEGALLHERALKITAELDELETELGTRTATPSGSLRIGAPMEIGRRRIAPLLAEFGRRHPRIASELVLSDAGQEPLRDALDFVFRTTEPEDPDVACVTLLPSRRVVCAAPAYLARHPAPERPEDLARHDCLRLVRGRRVYDRWRFLREGRPVRVAVGGTLSSTSGEVIHDWALAGHGIALKAAWDIAEDLRAGRLVECLAEYAGEDFSLYGVFPARPVQPVRLRLLIDYVKAAMRELVSPPAS
jgi:DNA-binding transcriptional LysR family regulator